MDQIYNQQQDSLYKIEYSNLKNKNKRMYSFGVRSWFGINTNLASTKLSDKFQSDLLNCLPAITYIKKSPGAVATGFHGDTDILNNKEALHGGYIEVPKDGKYLWKIVRNESQDYSDFYYLKDTSSDINGVTNEVWILSNPVDKYGNVYHFVGVKFNSDKFQHKIYVCSGVEWYSDGLFPDPLNANQTLASGLLEFDFYKKTWSTVPTGKSAKMNLSNPNADIEAIKQDPVAFQNSLQDFNPSLVCEHNGQLFIAGDEYNPYQMKVSEVYNLKNFIAGVLGANYGTSSIEDNNRPYTTLVQEEIKSLNSFGDKVIIGCPSRFYYYERINTGGNVDNERVQPDTSGHSGVANQWSTKVYQGGSLFFNSDFQITPEFSVKSGQWSMGMARANFQVSTAQPLSQNVQEIMETSIVDDSCLGFYGAYVFNSISKCKKTKNYAIKSDKYKGKNQFLYKNDTVLVYRRDGDYVLWSRLDYIKANYFFEAGNRGLYYCSSQDGNIYRLDETTNYIDNKSDYNYQEDSPSSYNDNPQQFVSKIKTQITGVAQNDNNMTEKVFEQLYLVGGFSDDTVLDIKIFEVGGNCNTCQGEPIDNKTLLIKYTAPNVDCDSCDTSCVPDQNLNYYKYLQYFKKKILFNKPKYTELYIEITITNSFDFYLSDLNGIYSNSNDDPNYLILDCNQQNMQPINTQDYTGNQKEYHCSTCNL